MVTIVDVKKRFLTFFILATFFTFLTFFFILLDVFILKKRALKIPSKAS